MEDNNQLSFPEEDEDLEALRLAALQSLKRRTNNEIQPIGHFGKDKLTHFNGSPRGKPKRGKFQRQVQGRTPRNGQFNGWTRNSNLIAVPMVTEEENKRVVPDDIPKLVLPQDRYCKVEKTPGKSDTLTSKFDRYDNSDESESDSEEEPCKTRDTEEKPDLQRSNSLEALMAELENEIQGVAPAKLEESPKPKPKKRRKPIVAAASPKPAESKPPPLLKENLKPETHEPAAAFRQRKWPKPRRNPPPGFPPPHRAVAPPPIEIVPPMAFVPPVQAFPPFNALGFDGGVYVPPPAVFESPPPRLLPMCVAPPVYERPPSPLAINTDAYSTIALAPLSPRSAAFVMENRAIVEKRKRRSWSRSPSPGRFRRSKTPKRLSLSPKRPSRSPKRRSLSPSPVRKVLLPRTNSPKKAPIHDRLGLKASKTETDDDKDKDKNNPPKKEDKKEVLDPVLEARRRKFERKEITMTEGVIRLKKERQEEGENAKREEAKPDEAKEDEEEEFDEDALLEGDADPEDFLLLDHKMDALFSDEESDSDNEGRFKTKQETNQKSHQTQKAAVLPFAKLINGSKGGDAKAEPRAEEKKSERPKGDRRKRFRSRTPVKNPPKKVAAKTPKKSEKVKQSSIGFANERKIEIKIRNPAKYERAEAKGGEEKGRKVEVAKKDEDVEKVEESAEEAATTNITEGDLRAQLSRKRAERQKHPLPDVVPSRLLQSALQGVGFRKGKKSKSKDENSEGKLPIHLRLGAAAAASPEPFGKKSRKHKNKGASQEQV